MSFFYGKRKRNGTVTTRPRFARRKVGYRKYVRKATGVKTRKPARLGYSRRNYRFNARVARSLVGMAETKIIPHREVEFSQPAGAGTTSGIATVKFITGNTALAQYGSYTPVGGFSASQGDGKNNRDGQFIYLKHSTCNLTISMDHIVTNVAQRAAAIQFRVLIFKGKRAMDPSGVTPNPDVNLFLQNNGNNFGDNTPAPSNMKVLDMMLQPPNTNSYRIISDRKFTLQHTTENDLSNPGTGIAQTNFPSFKNIPIKLTHNTKARYSVEGTQEPVDYNYRYAVAVYAFYANQQAATPGDIPVSWSASWRGTTGFADV